MRVEQPITAFPTTESNWYDEDVRSEGMTLRDYFAAKAMQGDWASQSEDYNLARYTDDALDKQAKIYYRMADAMLRAREK